LENELANDGQAGTYVWYLLRYRVAEILKRRPSPEDLDELVLGAWPGFPQVMRAG
jgi:hypothetical protein